MSAVTAEATTLRWSVMRVAIGLVLLLWAVMFWTLWLTGRTYLYLSSRTAWLVPMGAIIMSVAAIGRLWTAVTAKEEPLEPRTTWALGVIAVPVVLILALPPSALGAFSASKRSTFSGSAIGATARDVTGPLDFVDIGAAQSFPTAMQELEARAGQPITLEGFVTQDASAPPDEILLTRYIVTCCVACNRRKGGRTPSEAGMRLHRTPRRPPFSMDRARASPGVRGMTTAARSASRAGIV